MVLNFEVILSSVFSNKALAAQGVSAADATLSNVNPKTL